MYVCMHACMHVCMRVCTDARHLLLCVRVCHSSDTCSGDGESRSSEVRAKDRCRIAFFSVSMHAAGNSDFTVNLIYPTPSF